MNKQFSDKMAETGFKVFMLITGGGMSAATETTRHGGASRWFIGASLPYAGEVSADYCWDDTSRVSAKAAAEMAWAASNIHHGIDRVQGNKIVAVCTAKLTYEGERAGREHAAHLHYMINNTEYSYKLTLQPGTREEQERACGNAYCALILHHATSDETVTLSGLEQL